MSENKFTVQKIEALTQWLPPVVPEDIPHGDMPGDKVSIGEEHVQKANILFPVLLRELAPVLRENPHEKAVVTVCGGSGVGKSEIASLLSYYLSRLEIGSYTLSGDNYPHRIPKYNDAERLHIFRESALKNMICTGDYTPERFAQIYRWQKEGMDANPAYAEEFPWFDSYLRGGRKGLEDYLGTDREIGFEEIGAIVRGFKEGEEAIWLKRMGRNEEELWYEQMDFSRVNILVIEWTHGNSDYYEGVDIPILLNSTPAETLAHRRARNRDGATDSPFTTMVLEIEQKLLERQAHKAKIILSKSGELLTYEAYRKQMAEQQERKEVIS